MRTIDAIAEQVDSIAAEHGCEIRRLIVFGSYADGTAAENSDVDLVLVSPDFEGVDFYARTEEFYWYWDPNLPKIDLIPLTPAEFDDRSEDPSDIVHEAVETGRDVTPARA